MRNCLVLALAMLIASLSAAEASEPADTYLSKSYWQKMDWEKAETSRLWQMNGWAQATGEQPSYATFIKKRKLTLLGHEFDANLAYKNGLYLNQHFTSLYAKIPRAECDRLLKEVSARFGKPISNDGSMRVPIAENAALMMTDLMYEWTIGETRLNASCSGSVSETAGVIESDDKYMWSMKFAHLSLDNNLVPKFALACTRTITFAQSGKTDRLDDLVAWFDLSKSRALNIDLVMISDLDSFKSDDDMIEFSTTRKSFLMTYRISRVSGSLTAIVAENGQIVGKITGACEKTDAPVRKF